MFSPLKRPSERLPERLFLYLHAGPPLRRRLLILAALLPALASLLMAHRIRIDDDFMVMLPAEDPVLRDFAEFNDTFHQMDRMYFDVSVSDTSGSDEESLFAAADMLHSRLAGIEEFSSLTYRLDTTGQSEMITMLIRLAPCLLRAGDYEKIEPMLEPEALRAHLARMKRDLSGPQGMMLKHILPLDPVGFAPLLLARLESLRAGVGDAQIAEGRIVSGDGRHLMMIAEPSFPSSAADRNQALMERVDAVIAETEAAFASAGLSVGVTGGHRATLDNVTMVRRDVSLTLTVASVSMILLSLLAYRRRWLALMTLLPAGFGALVALLLLAVTHPALYSVSTGFGIILLGITVDYAIHVLYHLEDAGGDTPRQRATRLAAVARPVMISAMTTVAAFMLMTFSPVRGHRQVGWFAAAGLLSAAGFSLLVLPVLIPKGRPAADGAPQADLLFSRWFGALSRLRERKQVWFLAATAVLTAASVIGVTRLEFDGDIARLNGLSEKTRKAESELREAWGDAFALTSIMVRGGDEQAALESNDRLAELLEDMRVQGRISSVSTLSDLIPSVRGQRANLAKWNEFWTPGRRDRVTAMLAEISAGLGYRAGAFRPFLDLLAGTPEPFTPGRFDGTPLAEMLAQRMAPESDGLALTAMVSPADDEARAELAARIRAEIPGAVLLDGRAITGRISEIAREDLKTFALWGCLAVLVILRLTFGYIELVVITLVPLAFAVLWTFGVMGLAGVPVDVFNAIFIIFIIGVGIDYSVFMTSARVAIARGGEDRMRTTGGSVTICALTTIIACGVLALARHPALFSVGLTCLLGMIFCFSAAVVISPWCAWVLFPPRSGSGSPRWTNLLGGVYTVAYLLGSQWLLLFVARPIAALRFGRDRERAGAWLRASARRAMRLMFDLFPGGGMDYFDVGPETFARPAIAVSNHLSSVDVALIASMPGDLRLTPKERVWNQPYMGPAARRLGHILVERGDPEATLERCRAALDAGALVHFFPEGTRSEDGFMGRFHKGAFELAVRLDADVLPLVICHTNMAIPHGAFWTDLFHGSVRALPRVTPRNFDYSLGARALMKHVKGLIAEAYAADLARLNTPQALLRKVRRRYRYMGRDVEKEVLETASGMWTNFSLERLIPPGSRVIEAGCGYGACGHLLTELTGDRRYLGLDGREDRIRIARRSLLGKRRADFISPELTTGWNAPAADAILITETSAAWGPEDLPRVLTPLLGSLAEGGLVILATTPFGPGFEERQPEVAILEAAGFVRSAAPADSIRFRTAWRRRGDPGLYGRRTDQA